MSRPGFASYELATAQTFASACKAKFVKLLVVCEDEPKQSRCYYCDFNGNLGQIVLGRHQLNHCFRFIGRIRATKDSRARHWTQLVDRDDAARYWQNEVAIAVERGKIIAKEIEEKRRLDEEQAKLSGVRESSRRVSENRPQGAAA